MLMKQLTSIITKVNDRVKNNSVLSMLYYAAITIAVLVLYLFSSSGKANYIYNQF